VEGDSPTHIPSLFQVLGQPDPTSTHQEQFPSSQLVSVH